MQMPEQPAANEILSQEQQEPYSEEDILKGKRYPPPPSFYQKQREIQQKQPERVIPPIRYTPEAALPKTSYVPPKTSSGPGSTQSPIQAPARTQAAKSGRAAVKRSRKWMWIVGAILSASLVISCSLCGWAAYNLFSVQFQEALGARDSVNTYYKDMQAKNYAHAYTYLDFKGGGNNLSQEQFIQQAIQQDATYGPILSYTPDTPTFGTGASQSTDINQSTVTVEVGRKKRQYTVTLTLNREGNIWKIANYTLL